MAYTVKKVEVWAGDIMNRPGALARVLESMRNAGASLEFMVARRVSEETSRVFLSPIKGVRQKRAAGDVGLVPAAGMHSIRVEGPDRAGLGAAMTRALGDQSINIRGASAAAVGRRAVFYFGFADEAESKKAISALKRALRR